MSEKQNCYLTSRNNFTTYVIQEQVKQPGHASLQKLA